MKIGNTSFNVAAMQGMKFEDFKKQFKGVIHAPGLTLEQVFEQLTGQKVERIIKTDGPIETKIDEPNEKKSVFKKVKKENDENPSF